MEYAKNAEEERAAVVLYLRARAAGTAAMPMEPEERRMVYATIMACAAMVEEAEHLKPGGW